MRMNLRLRLIFPIVLLSSSVAMGESSPFGEAATAPAAIAPGLTADHFGYPTPPPKQFLSPDRIASVLGNIHPEEGLVTRSGRGASIYQEVAPSVVLVVTDSGLGSGALISDAGDIITNWHVVAGAERVGVVFKPVREGDIPTRADLRMAELVRYDEVTDLALLRVAELPAGRTPVQLGSLDSVLIGADVHAIGHPSGESWTYTRGFVSQIRRGYQWYTASGVEHQADVVQTQTPINPGNSGGPLLDENGGLIGINSFKAEGEALNFAVAVDEVRSFLARPDSRIAKRIAPDENSHVAETGDCEWNTVASERRSIGGKAGGMMWVDANCDGEPDFQVFLPDDSSEPIALLADTTGDGNLDTVFLDVNRNGEIDISLIDTNGDGSADLQGFHRNGDMEPYSVQRIG